MFTHEFKNGITIIADDNGDNVRVIQANKMCPDCDCECDDNNKCPECGKVVKASTKTAQAQNPTTDTMPKDVEDEVDAGVPRDESVGLKQTEPKDVIVYEHEYKPGDKKSDDKVVPRSGAGGDGVSDSETTFDAEKGVDQTSGNPDTYIQSVQPRTDPTPHGNAENRAVAKSELETRLAAVENELDTYRSEIEKAKTRTERFKVAYQIAHEEATRGWIEDTEEHLASRAEELVNESVSALKRELARVKQYPTVKTAGKNPETGNIRKTAGFEHVAGYALQSLASSPSSDYAATIKEGTKTYKPGFDSSDLVEKIKSELTLNKRLNGELN